MKCRAGHSVPTQKDMWQAVGEGRKAGVKVAKNSGEEEICGPCAPGVLKGIDLRRTGAVR